MKTLNDLDYIYLRTLPNFVIKDGHRLHGKVLNIVIKLTALNSRKKILEKWKGFTIHELIYLDYEF